MIWGIAKLNADQDNTFTEKGDILLPRVFFLNRSATDPTLKALVDVVEYIHDLSRDTTH